MKLIQGDCLKVLKTLPDESVDLVLSDPPYGINFLSSWTNHHHKLENDSDERIDLLYAKFMPEVKRVLKPRGVCCCCGGGGKRAVTALATIEFIKHLDLIQTVVWSKGKSDGSFVGLGWRYRPSYENILVGAKNISDYAFYPKFASNVFVCKPLIPKEGEHPTVKPLRLMEFFIKNHTKEGDVVLDPFMGSGTTLVAAKRLGRNGIGIELDAKYFKIAEKRVNDAVEFGGLNSFGVLEEGLK